MFGGATVEVEVIATQGTLGGRREGEATPSRRTWTRAKGREVSELLTHAIDFQVQLRTVAATATATADRKTFGHVWYRAVMPAPILKPSEQGLTGC